MSLNGACTPEVAQTGPSEHGDGRLRACQERFWSVRFARYSAQELAAASESLLFRTVGDIDQRIPGNWATRMASKQVSRNLVSYHKSSPFLVGPRRHQGRAMEMPISLSGA
jgi:hypothetical protein